MAENERVRQIDIDRGDRVSAAKNGKEKMVN
jgi:hypothetical protein